MKITCIGGPKDGEIVEVSDPPSPRLIFPAARNTDVRQIEPRYGFESVFRQEVYVLGSYRDAHGRIELRYRYKGLKGE